MDTVTDNHLTVFETVDFTTPEGASTSGLPSDGGTALYKELTPRRLTANFEFADPPTVVANLVAQQLQTADDMICQAMNFTEVYWGSPWMATPPKTMLMSDMTMVREQLQTIRCRLRTPAGPGTESHAAAIADNTPQLAISSFPGSAEQCSIAPDLARNAAAHMHQHYGVHGKCSSNLPADELGRSGAPTGAVRALGNTFNSEACATAECLAIPPASPQDSGGEPLPSYDQPCCPECGTKHCPDKCVCEEFASSHGRLLDGSHHCDECCTWFELPAADQRSHLQHRRRSRSSLRSPRNRRSSLACRRLSPLLDSGRDVGDHFSDARRDDCSGMPPAIDQARTDLGVRSVERASGGILAAAAVATGRPKPGLS